MPDAQCPVPDAMDAMDAIDAMNAIDATDAFPAFSAYHIYRLISRFISPSRLPGSLSRYKSRMRFKSL